VRTRDAKTATPVRVALVQQYTMVAETFSIAIRPTCAAIPVVIDPGTTASSIASAVLAVRADIAVLHLDSTVPDDELPIEQLVAAGLVVTVLTDRRDDARLGSFIERGAEAALSTELGLRRLVTVIARVGANQSAMAPGELDRLRGAARTMESHGTGAEAGLSRLSTREGEVLRYLMAGLAPAQIARLNFVAETTVRTQVRSVLGKLNVSSQLAAVAIAYRAGWQPREVTAVAG
jgi:two-component system nitrate/nitrite response regulator NarL